MISDELAKLSRILPLQVKEVHFKQDILSLQCGVLFVSIRCPFEYTVGEKTYSSPGAPAKYADLLQGRDLNALEVEGPNYPDLILHFDMGRLRARPPHGGEEMWYVDAPGVVFVSP